MSEPENILLVTPWSAPVLYVIGSGDKTIQLPNKAWVPPDWRGKVFRRSKVIDREFLLPLFHEVT
jgi:hypothetical protein